MAGTELVHAYVEEAAFREHMGDSGSKLNADQVRRCLNASSRAIDKFCGRRFWKDPASAVRHYRPRDPDWVIVDDIYTSTGLVIETGPGDGTFTTTWSASSYELGPANAVLDGKPFWSIVALSNDFPTSGRGTTVRITTTAFGWAEIPVEAEQACLIKTAKLFGRKDSRDGVRGFSEFGPVRISRFEDPDVVDLLEDFIRITKPEV